MQKRGFSLMEMMVVMLIVAIIAAATAPMINKKMIENASGDSPWIWTSATNNSIAFNIRGVENAQAVIGAVKPSEETKSRLHIESGNYIPQMTLGEKNETYPMKLYFGKKSLVMSNSQDDRLLTHEGSVFIGNDTTGNNSSVAIGNKVTSGSSSVAIGNEVTMKGSAGVLIGANVSDVQNTNSYHVAIGNNAKVNNASIAVGYNAHAEGGQNAIAIGRSTYANNNSAIAIGSPPSTNTTPFTYAYGGSSIAIGSEVKAGTEADKSYSNSTIAIGRKANTVGNYTIAIGYNSTIKKSQYSPNVYPNNSIAIGYNASVEKGSDSIVIGSGANTQIIGTTGSIDKAIVIGAGANAQHENTIAIGYSATAHNQRSVAIGEKAYSEGQAGMAIGYNAKANHSYSMAIGNAAGTESDPSVTTTASNQIVLGNANTTVYIPGNLAVGRRTVLGLENYDVYLNVGDEEKPMSIKEGSADMKPHQYWSDDILPGYKVTSDRRLKDVGEVFKAGLEEVKKLEVFNYTFKKDPNKTPRVGVMAQDLEKIFPKAVMKGDDGFLRIRMEDMFYAVVNAIKELDTKLTAVVEEVKTAVTDITDLKIKSAEYEKTIAELVEQNKAQAKALKDLEKRLAKLEKKAKKTPVVEEEIEE